MRAILRGGVVWVGIGAILLAASALAIDFQEGQNTPASGEEVDKETHEELIALRERIVKSYQERDVEGILKNLREDVVVTWQNAEVSRGHQGVRDFYDVMMKVPNSVVANIQSSLKVDELSRLYLDKKLAVAVGVLEDDFTLRDGKQFHLKSRWTASLVRDEDQWRIAAFHVSTNMFDNGVLDLTVQQNRLYVGLIAGGVGILLGVIGGLVLGRRRSA